MKLTDFRTLRVGQQVTIHNTENVDPDTIGIVRKIYSRNATVALPDNRLKFINFTKLELL